MQGHRHRHHQGLLSKFRSHHQHHQGCVAEHDIYAHTPKYEWRSISGRFSKFLVITTIVMTVLYITFSGLNFLQAPPDILRGGRFGISPNETFPVPFFGFEILYFGMDNVTGQPVLHKVTDHENGGDRYFTWEVEHVILQHQTSLTSSKANHDMKVCSYEKQNYFCMDRDQRLAYPLQGDYLQPKYQYMNIRINRCVNVTSTGQPCAPVEEVMDLINSPNGVHVYLLMESQSFDPDQFQETGDGLTNVALTWRWFAKSGVSQQHQVYFTNNEVSWDGRWFGSYLRSLFGDRGSFAAHQESFLEFDIIDTQERPQGPNVQEQVEFMEFFIRLDRLGVKSEMVRCV